MKKIISAIFASLIFCSSVFCGFFNSRVIELKAVVPVGINNNLLSIDQFLEDEIVIDVKKIAESIPVDGFLLKTAIAPDLEFNLNFSKFHLGVDVNLDVRGGFGLGKDLFKFLADGYSYDSWLKIKTNINAEAYLSAGVNIGGIRRKKVRWNIRPSIYVPLLMAESNSASLNFNNTSDGKVKLDIDGSVNLYHQFAYTDSNAWGFDYLSLSTGNDLSKGDAMTLLTDLLNVAGYDIAGEVEFPMMRVLDAIVNFSCPILPGKFTTKTSYSLKDPIEIDVSGAINDYFATKEFDVGEINPEYKITSEYVDVKINRPLKLDGYLKFKPFRNNFYILGGAGIGVRAPFTEFASIYPEYKLESGFSIISGMLSSSISTEYTNETYIHRATLGVGLRLVQIGIGLSLEGSDIENSLNISGLGGLVMVCVGL